MKFASLLCFWFFSLLSGYCYSQGNIFYLTPEQGLSNRTVTDIYQDKDGFMWFGTFDGLNRYDGYEMKVFRNRTNDSNTLPGNRVRTLCSDKDNNIWVGTGNGVGIYDPLTRKFSGISYQSSRAGVSRYKMTSEVSVIRKNMKGDIFIAFEDRGLWICRRGKRVAEQIFLTVDGKEIKASRIIALARDLDDRMWFFAEGVGLCRYDEKSNTAFLVNRAFENGRFLKTGPGGDLWFGAEQGLFVFNIKTGVFSRKLNSVVAKDVFFDRNGDHWLATDGNGLFLRRSGERDFSPFKGLENDKMQNIAFGCLFGDDQGQLWIGSIREGVTIIDRKEPFFKSIQYRGPYPASRSVDFVAALSEDRSNNLWIGRDGDGLSRWNLEKRTLVTWLNEPGRAGSLPSNFVTNILTDSLGEVWIATWGGGVGRYNRKSDSFKKFVCYNSVSKRNDLFAWTLYKDKSNDFWVGTCEGGLYKMDKTINEFRLFDARLTNVVSLYEDKKGQMWGGNYSSLIRIDRRSKRSIVYHVGQPVRTILEDKNGRFWIGTEGGGLLLFNRATGKYLKFTEEDGLCNNFILSMIEDDVGNLWICTLNGMSKFEPKTKIFTSFSELDGLRSSQFNYHSSIALRSGEFVVGGIKGLNIFNPLANFRSNTIADLQLTSVEVDNTPVEDNVTFFNKRIGDHISELEIPHDKAALSFEFAIPEYIAPGKIRYAYYLEGWDGKWSAAGSIRSANYPRLREGNYIFKVKATDTNGVWQKKEIQVKITVLPPWYRTWWAFGLYVVVIIGAVYTYIRQQREKERMKYEKELFQLKVNEEKRYVQYQLSLAQLKAEKEKEQLRHKVQLADLEREKEREINEGKLSFFTRISHEIRTHLTLIAGPVEWLLSLKKEDPQVQYQLGIAKSNSDRLLKLVNELMDFRKMESTQSKLQISPNNLIPFLENILASFHHITESKEIDLTLLTGSEDITLWYDPNQMQKVIFNLLMNAYKFTPEGGKIIVSVEEEKGQVQIKVSDNGKGISPEHLDKLFTNFFQVEQSGRQNAGSGIGLALSKGIVDFHKGSLNVTSEVAGNGFSGGTIFKVTLLKGNAHFETAEYHIQG